MVDRFGTDGSRRPSMPRCAYKDLLTREFVRVKPSVRAYHLRQQAERAMRLSFVPSQEADRRLLRDLSRELQGEADALEEADRAG